MLRILQLVSSNTIGGAEMTCKMTAENIPIYTFFLRRNDGKDSWIVDHSYFGTTSNFYKYNPLVLFKLIKLTRELEIKVVHANSIATLVYGLLVKLLFPKIKLIYHEHGEIFFNKKLPQLLKIADSKINLYLAVSNVAKQKLQEIGVIDSKIIVVYNFITENFEYSKQENLKMSESKELRIGYLGRLSNEKGVDILINACSLLDIKYKLLIAGDGAEKKSLEELSRNLNVENKVKFIGFVYNVNEFYSQLDILVIPSRFESFGKVGLEGQKQGIPIIVSDVGGLPEIFNDGVNALMFHSENSTELAKKIKLIASNKNLRNQLIEKGKENAEKYNLENYIGLINKIYIRILHEE